MTQGEGGGRPPVVFNEQQVKQVEQLAGLMTKAQLADFMEISEPTFRAVEARQPEVYSAYKKGKAMMDLRFKNNLRAQSDNGNVAATIFYLKTQCGWKEPEAVQHSHGPITIEIVDPYVEADTD